MSWARGLMTVALLVVLTGCVGDGSASDPHSPRGAVERLKTALVEPDAAALVELVGDPSYNISTDLLTDQVVGEGVFAGKDVTIDKTQGDLNGQRYDLRMRSDRGRPWLDTTYSATSSSPIGSLLPTIRIMGAGVESLTVNGVVVDIAPVPSGGQSYYLPPGTFQIGVAASGTYADFGPPLTVETRDRSQRDLTFTGQLTGAARSIVRDKVAAFVKRCTAKLEGKRPRECPVRKVWVGADLISSEWTLSAQPKIRIEANGGRWRITTPEPPTARMHGVIRDRTDGSTEQVSDSLPFAVDGDVTVRDDQVDVRIPSR